MINNQPIDFIDPSIFVSIAVALIVVIVSLSLIMVGNLNLHYLLGIELIIIYIIYFIFEYYNSMYYTK